MQSDLITENQSKQDLIFKQYSLYVEMADRISQRRNACNIFFISLFSAISGFLVYCHNPANSIIAKIIFCSLLIGLCIIWIKLIQSYKSLNAAKFQVINDMEEYLPVKLFSKEYEIYKKERFEFSVLEQWIPIVFAGACLVLFFAI